MQIKLANYDIKDLLQDLKPNVTLLNKEKCATATVTIIHKQRRLINPNGN